VGADVEIGATATVVTGQRQASSQSGAYWRRYRHGWQARPAALFSVQPAPVSVPVLQGIDRGRE